MDLYEMEIALNDGYTLTYIDDEYRQCFIEYAGSEIVKITKQTSFREDTEYANMSALLIELETNNITVKIH